MGVDGFLLPTRWLALLAAMVERQDWEAKVEGQENRCLWTREKRTITRGRVDGEDVGAGAVSEIQEERAEGWREDILHLLLSTCVGTASRGIALIRDLIHALEVASFRGIEDPWIERGGNVCLHAGREETEPTKGWGKRRADGSSGSVIVEQSGAKGAQCLREELKLDSIESEPEVRWEEGRTSGHVVPEA